MEMNRKVGMKMKVKNVNQMKIQMRAKKKMWRKKWRKK
jgi:hypothetical protein